MRRAFFLNSGQNYLHLIGWDAQAAGNLVFENKQNKTAMPMASRFGVADSDVIQNLKASSENRNEKKHKCMGLGV
jgi:hypothetical protein